MSESTNNKIVIEQKDENTNKQLIETFLRDYLPYWPVLLTFALVGFFTARIYIRYQIPQYKVDAGILLKDASEETTDDLLRKAVTGKSNTSNEDELEVLKGARVMRRAVKKSESQVRIIAVGRFRSSEVYSDDPVLKISLINPDSAVSVKDRFDFDFAKNKLVIGNNQYPIGQVFDWKGNRILVSINSNAKKVQFADFRNIKGRSLFINILSLDDATKEMQSSLKVETDKKSSIINLAVISLSKLKSLNHLNAIVESYQEETQAEKRKKARFTMDFIDDRLSYIGNDLDSIESRMVSVKKNNDVQRISIDAQRVLRKLESGDQLNAQTELQLFVLDDLERYVKGRISKPGMVPSSIGLTDANLNTYFDQLYEAENKYSVALSNNGPNNDQVRLIKKEIDTYKASLLEIIQNTRNNLLTIQRKAQGDYSKYNREYDDVMRSIPSKERELLDITRQQEIKNALYKFLLEKREEAAIQMAGTLSDIRIVREPFGGDMVSPKIPQTLGLFTMGFALIALVLLFLKSTIHNRVLSRTEIENRTNAPIIGEIVEIRTDSPLVVKDGNRTLIAEQFRGLRTQLSFFAHQNRCNRILVASSLPGEGKSFCATNIALSFALAGKKTVVIESDMRKPNVARYLNVSRRTGLSGYLSGSSTKEEILFAVKDTENLWVIPAGAIPPNPVELILNGLYAQLLDELSKDFDYIIIDCPPLGLVTDAQEIAKFVDSTVFVVRQGYTPREAIVHILNRYYEEGRIQNMNVLLNGIRGGISGYGYGYNYGYGNGYGYGYGYGTYNYSYGYGYYGSENKAKNPWLDKFNGIFIAPFLAFVGYRNKAKKNK
jgi:capsular exopolysaccharide synthesis family protein